MSLITYDLIGKKHDKVQIAIDRLRAFEPEDGYYLAFSGGKDSQCIYHLAVMAGVKFDAHYRITSVDPPELVRFIKTQYPDVHMEYPHVMDWYLEKISFAEQTELDGQMDIEDIMEVEG